MNSRGFSMHRVKCRWCQGTGLVAVGAGSSTSYTPPVFRCSACQGSGMTYEVDWSMSVSYPIMPMLPSRDYLDMPDVERYVNEVWGEPE